MTSLQVRDAPNELSVLSRNISDLLILPDPEAAEALNLRMGALRWVEETYRASFSDRLVIIREFAVRQLWRYLIDPEVGQPFPDQDAWLRSGFLGCRRVNYEALRYGKLLPEMKAAALLGLPKESIKVLPVVPTSIRNQPDFLEAAKVGDDALLDKLEKEHPLLHLEARKPLRFRFGRSQARKVEEWISWALEHDVAGTREEAIEWACVEALENAQIDARLDGELVVEEARV